MRPPDELLSRAERLLGSRPASWRRGEGGYSIADRWSLSLEDGRKVFAKMAPTNDLAVGVRDEYRHMSMVDADFRCEIVAYEDAERPLLLLEDLSHAHWPPPWEPGEIERVRTTLERIWGLDASRLSDASRLKVMFDHWNQIADDRSGFLSLGLVSPEWLDRNVDALRDAARGIRFDGDDFLHMDVRSDNLCISDDRVVFVDWNHAVRGRRELDLAGWLPALRLEGGPLPEEIERGLGPQAAGICGYFGWWAPQPISPGAPTVRRFQLRQLRITLPWACRELGIEQPDEPWAMREIEQIDADLATDRIDETTWHARIEESLIDAYLASDDPRGQSGKGGDETDWRWARELILDVFPSGESTFLDIGCANGYLMESVHRWGAERGLVVEPYGLDISWRIAALAKHRLRHWRDRIFVGNAIDWDAPMRFDVVQAGIDEVPMARRRELVDRILATMVKPGGVLVCRANRVGSGWDDPHVQLRELGLREDGIIERVHPASGDLRRTAWLRAPVR
ncbi:MAG: class I SAM-dependent methyltransferase [Actinomycetota bacterium]